MFPIVHPINLFLELCSLNWREGKKISENNKFHYAVITVNKTHLCQFEELSNGVKGGALSWIIQQYPIILSNKKLAASVKRAINLKHIKLNHLEPRDAMNMN